MNEVQEQEKKSFGKIGVVIAIAVLACGFIGVVGAIIGFGIIRPILHKPTEAVAVPTPPCIEDNLVIGDRRFLIQPVPINEDGKVAIESYNDNVAYWVQGTINNSVFYISSSPDNLNLFNLTNNQAILTWANCNSSTYTLFPPITGVPDFGTIFDQTLSGITIVVGAETDSGFILRGEITGGEIIVASTPDYSDIMAEISLIAVTTSEDKATIQVEISILNAGNSTLTLTSSDIKLIQADGTPLDLLISNPSLPKEIEPNQVEDIQLIYPRPATPSAIINIFSIEYDLEGY